MATDNKRKLYEALSQDYDMGTYEQFCNDLNDEAKRRKLYDATSQDYDFGTWDSFSQQLGYGPAAEPASERQDSPTQQPILTNTEEKTWQPTEQEKLAMSHQLHQIQARNNAMFDLGKENLDNNYKQP